MKLIDSTAKTNWVFIGVIAITAVLVGGGVFWYASQQEGHRKQQEVPAQGEETAPKSIEVLSPNEEEEWMAGETHTITWKAQGLAGEKVRISLAAEERHAFFLIADVPAGQGQYSWQVPPEMLNELLEGKEYRIMVAWPPGRISKVEVEDQSDAPFRIAESSIADWQTYRSEEYGFEVEYPKRWFNTTSEERNTIYDENNDPVELKHYEFSNKSVGVFQIDINQDIKFF